MLKNKIKKDNFGENHKKTMRRNTVAINNVLKKKNYKTKFSISFILKKKSKNIILKNKEIK